MIAMEIHPFCMIYLGPLYALKKSWYCIGYLLRKRGFLAFASKFHKAMCHVPNQRKLSYRISRKEKERSISELIFDLRRARQAAGGNDCAMDHLHSTLKNKPNAMKNGWLIFWDLKMWDPSFEPKRIKGWKCMKMRIFFSPKGIKLGRTLWDDLENSHLPTIVMDPGLQVGKIRYLHARAWFMC